jgi:hypothetical protein
MTSRVRSIELPLAFPIWAQNIKVRRSGRDLIVSGESAEFEAVPAGYLQQMGHEDLLRTYRTATESGKRPPHLQFANATSDDQLLAFVNRYGPVAAKRAHYDATDQTVNAVQNIRVLRREQKILSCAVRLWGALAAATALVEQMNLLQSGITRQLEHRDRSGEAVARARHAKIANEHRPHFQGIYETVAELGELTRPNPKREDDQTFPWGDSSLDSTFLVRHALKKGDYERAAWFGHRVLCLLLDKFPCRLLFERGRVMELPEQTPFGIRPALYFMLRSDYQRGREIQICQRTECGQSFVVERAGGKYCSPRCSKLQRQRDYWAETGTARRRLRTKAKQRQVTRSS